MSEDLKTRSGPAVLTTGGGDGIGRAIAAGTGAHSGGVAPRHCWLGRRTSSRAGDRGRYPDAYRAEAGRRVDPHGTGRLFRFDAARFTLATAACFPDGLLTAAPRRLRAIRIGDGFGFMAEAGKADPRKALAQRPVPPQCPDMTARVQPIKASGRCELRAGHDPPGRVGPRRPASRCLRTALHGLSASQCPWSVRAVPRYPGLGGLTKQARSDSRR